MKNCMNVLFTPREIGRILGSILGAFLYALGMNLFIIPICIYSGGIMGVCQILRTILVDYLHLPFRNFDIAGIIYYAMNIPAIILAYKMMGKMFFIKTAICMTAMTIFLSIIPISSDIQLTNDILSSCLIGGIICGAGCGLALLMGGSAGGMDIISLYFIKKKGSFSVGKVYLIVNFFVYTICFFLFDVTIVIYSIIFASVSSIALDKVHSQNINVEVIIITRKNLRDLQLEVMSQLGRGITKWNTTGAYTQEGSEILYIILSKFEISQLKRMVHKYDPEAFIVLKEGVTVTGNYLRKL